MSKSDPFDFMPSFLASLENRAVANRAVVQAREQRQADYLAKVAAQKAEQAAQAAKKKKRVALRADTSDSECFDELTYRAGVVTATFRDGSQYEYAISRADAKEWFSDPSLGTYFNENIR